MGGTKVCTKCGEEFPATTEYFNRSKKGCKLGLRGHCKICQGREGKEYYEKTKGPLEKDAILGSTKICISCGIEYLRTPEYFPKRKDNRDGLRNDCKSCNRQRSNKYREENKEETLKRCQEYHRINREALLKNAKKRYQSNREKLIESVHEYRKNNKEKVVQTKKNCYQKNKEKVLHKRKEYYLENKEEILEKDKIYKKKHIERYRVNQREWKKKKYATDIKFNLNEKITSGIRISLKSGKGGRHWETMVDFTVDQLIIHLDSLFKPGMTWAKLLNGEIHIDHIRPKASFNFTSPDDFEFKECWALSNLQPLWAEDNLKKRDKWNF
ncbi:MAG TPA: hypothetical protein VMW10_11275 [Alphaproteobacteria bacterium]|nr:hypothetical protein [Alphaproteobacteria bacterium]